MKIIYIYSENVFRHFIHLLVFLFVGLDVKKNNDPGQSYSKEFSSENVHQK